MTASDWDEIKRLASDFHRIQLSSSAQKLSERNCIEIVQRLIDLGILEVIFTTDGKEYLTPVELSKEILEELAVAGGRVNLVDLQQALNVDFKHIESKVNDLLRSEKNLKLILGQLISREYFDHLCEEINDKLQQQGLLTLSELARNYILPGDFLKELLREKLGSLIKGQLDDIGDHVFTESYMNRQQAVIRGIFSSIIRPTGVFQIISKLGTHERLLYSVLDKLIATKQLSGSISGGRPYNAVYTPDIYVKSQQEWVTSFFNQNSYLEYDGLTRLGISDPEGYAKRKFKNQHLEFLKSCCIGADMKERIEAEMEEALEEINFFDVTPHLPSVCTKDDSRIIANALIKKKARLILLGDEFIASESLIEMVMEHLNPLVLIKAEKTIIENPSILARHDKTAHVSYEEETSKEDKKDQRKKKSGTKGLGGLQGREVKTKAVKKKYNSHGNHKDDQGNDDDHEEIDQLRKKQETYIFMTIKELSEELSKMPLLKEASQDFCELLALRIVKDLNKMYNEELKSVFLQSVNLPSTAVSNSAPSKKKMFAEVSEKIFTLWSNVKLFEKGILHFKEDVQSQLITYLLKTICADISNLVFSLYAAEALVTLSKEDSVTNEERLNIVSSIKNEKAKMMLTKLNLSLNSKNLDDFFLHLDGICGSEFLNIPLKRNKNKDRQLLFSHRQSLTKSLASETNPALVIHITSVLLFQHVTNSMLHATGRFVPLITSFLKKHMKEDQHQLLLKGQELVIKQFSLPAGDGNNDVQKEELNTALDSIIPQIKELPLTFKATDDPNEDN